MKVRPPLFLVIVLFTVSSVWPVAGAARLVSKSTRHLAVTASLTPDLVKAGTKLSLVVDVRPKKGIHVYAPGTTYRPVAIAIERNPALTVEEVVYPRPASYLFKPLNETVLVYERPFRLTLGMIAGGTPAHVAALTAESRLTIKGQLTYQACDEKVCYLPESMPLDWSLTVSR